MFLISETLSLARKPKVMNVNIILYIYIYKMCVTFVDMRRYVL
jgi:hypothetical protein